MCPGAPAGLKTGARRSRAPVSRPAGAPGPNFGVCFWLICCFCRPPAPSMAVSLQNRGHPTRAQTLKPMETHQKAQRTSEKHRQRQKLRDPSPTYSMLHNNASGPSIGLPGRIWAGLLPGKHRNRLSGRLELEINDRNAKIVSIHYTYPSCAEAPNPRFS